MEGGGETSGNASPFFPSLTPYVERQYCLSLLPALNKYRLSNSSGKKKLLRSFSNAVFPLSRAQRQSLFFSFPVLNNNKQLCDDGKLFFLSFHPRSIAKRASPFPSQGCLVEN